MYTYRPSRDFGFEITGPEGYVDTVDTATEAAARCARLNTRAAVEAAAQADADAEQAEAALWAAVAVAKVAA